MAIRLLRFVLLVVTCVAADEARALELDRRIDQFQHTEWTIRDGMPANLNALAQTPDGYLWIGSSSGLYRFDGAHLERFGQRLPGGAALSFAVTSAGDLWIGAPDGVSRLSQGHLTNYSVTDLGLPSAVRHVALGRNGDVWVASDKVARFDGRSWRVMDSDWGSSELYAKPGGVWGLAVARDGVVWTKNLLGLYYLRPGATRFIKAEGYAGSIIDFAEAPDGRLWTADVATRRFYALPELGPSGIPPPPAQFGAPVPEGVLGRVSFDRDGALWCANAITGGLYRVRSVTASSAESEELRADDGRKLDAGARPFEDREGDIWIGTQTGLHRVAPANVVTESSIEIRNIGAQITATKDAIYVADGWPPPAPATAHREQKIHAITDGAPRALSLDVGDVMVLNAQGGDAPLIGSRKELLQLRDGIAAPIPFPEEVAGADLVSGTQHEGQVLAVFGDRGLFKRRAGAWTKVTAPGLATIATTRMRVDSQGGVWLFDGEQIRRLADGRLTDFSASRGPDIGGISAFVADSRGVVMAGEEGVSFFDGQQFHTLTRQQAPFLRAVLGVVADDVDGTWFHTSASIYRVSSQQLERAFRDKAVALDSQLFDARDGLRSTGTVYQFGGTAARGPDGRLWFLNAANVAWIDPHHLHRNSLSPPVSIKSLLAEGRAFDASVKKLKAGVSSLQIEYNAISLQSPDRVRFRYQLEGVDRGWVDANDRRQAFYTGLRPGQYKFKVIAANSDGVWSTTPASLQFEIPPTFVQSGWFALLCALLAGLALWLIYSLRMQQVTAALHRRYEERVAERERIARELHDTLLQAVQGLLLKFQSVAEEIPTGQSMRHSLEQALDRAEEVLIEGRDRVKDLRASPVNGLDLPTAIGEIGAELAGEHSSRFNLSVEGTSRTLDPIVGEEIMRIAREALANAFRHAHAAKIEAEIIYRRAELQIRFRDDGRGIETATLETGRPNHWGLPGMRERATKIRASLTLWSRPGAGTEIELRVPARIAYIRSERGWTAWWRHD